MVTSKQLATKRFVGTTPLPLDCNGAWIGWNRLGPSIRIIALVRAALEARAPVGYEDESGFHYGAETSGWFFTI
jgi:hypothetical protein